MIDIDKVASALAPLVLENMRWPDKSWAERRAHTLAEIAVANIEQQLETDR